LIPPIPSNSEDLTYSRRREYGSKGYSSRRLSDILGKQEINNPGAFGGREKNPCSKPELALCEFRSTRHVYMLLSAEFKFKACQRWLILYFCL